MTRIPLAAVGLLLAAATSTAAPVPKEIKKAAPKLDGTWEVTEWVSYGNAVNPGAANMQWVIDGESLTVQRNVNGKFAGAARAGRLKLVHPDGAAADAFDYMFANAPAGVQPRAYPGKAELNGDTLKYVYAPRAGSERPTEVAPGKTVVYYVFKRVTAADEGK